jgi:hypothetical protein
MRYFNTAGPCDAVMHYMVPPLERLPDVEPLVEQRVHVVVHAPRPMGKTTTLMALARRLTAEGWYAALYFTCELGRVFPDDIAADERAIWYAAREAAVRDLPEELRPRPTVKSPPGTYLDRQLRRWSRACPRQLVRWPYTDAEGKRAVQHVAIELKVWRDRDKKGDPLPQGLVQLDEYLGRLGLDEGVLVLFDARSAAAPIEERTRIEETRSPAGGRLCGSPWSGETSIRSVCTSSLAEVHCISMSSCSLPSAVRIVRSLNVTSFAAAPVVASFAVKVSASAVVPEGSCFAWRSTVSMT